MGKKLKKLLKGAQGILSENKIVAIMKLPEVSDNENIVVVVENSQGNYFANTFRPEDIEMDTVLIKRKKIKVVTQTKTRRIEDGLKRDDIIQNVNQISDKRKVLGVIGNIVFVSDKENYHLFGGTLTLQELINDKYILVTN